MRGIALDQFGGPEVLQLREDLPVPPVGPDTVLVRVRAAGVNPVDAKVRRGLLADAFPTWSPVVPGWDAAGIVEAVGPAVSNFRPGDEVFGYFRKDFIRDGTYAELTTIRDAYLARKPESLSFEEAGAAPLAALTAWQLIDETLRVVSGQLVLVCGASGGVGSFAVQLAKRAGASVVAVASAANHEYLKGLGADECIDYATEDFVEIIGRRHLAGVDAVVDLVGGDTLTRAAQVTRPRGKIASIIQEPPRGGLFAEHEIQGRYLFVRPDGGGLRMLARAFDAGELRVELADVLPLEQAARAHDLIELGHTRGKLVLRI
ncbi:MAG: NADP-dependent oxidoreductase [Solirubrobacteraceae bacterium]|nr:NADP-dependent oxidoreductase [Solirubrobacteraceae bacterium]